MKLLKTLLISAFLLLFSASTVFAHQSGCHRWHSCPSDSGSYTCGDTGYTSGCSYYSYPIYTYKTEYKTETVPFTSSQTEDSTLTKGETKVLVNGLAGIRTYTYSVTYKDGIESSRIQTASTITTSPVNEVIGVGTKIPSLGTSLSEEGVVAGTNDQQNEDSSSFIGWLLFFTLIGGLVWYFRIKNNEK